MYVCVCVCVCVCVYVCVYVHVCMYVCMFMYQPLRDGNHLLDERAARAKSSSQAVKLFVCQFQFPRARVRLDVVMLSNPPPGPAREGNRYKSSGLGFRALLPNQPPGLAREGNTFKGSGFRGLP